VLPLIQQPDLPPRSLRVVAEAFAAGYSGHQRHNECYSTETPADSRMHDHLEFHFFSYAIRPTTTPMVSSLA